MTALRKDAMDLLERMPEDKLYFIIQIMEGVNWSLWLRIRKSKRTGI